MDEEKNKESTDPKAEELSQDDLKQVSGGAIDSNPSEYKQNIK